MNKETTARATDTAPATLPAVECAAWCAYGDGHTDVTSPEDQACMSLVETVDLTVMPLVMFEGRALCRDTLSASLLRERDARSTTVELGHHDSPIATLTLDEALEYAHLLRTLASLAGGDQQN